MRFLRQLLLTVFGISAGSIAAGGVFTSLIAVGLIPRFAGKTHTGEKVFLYEEMVIAGTILGTGMSFFDLFSPFRKFLVSNNILGENTIVVLHYFQLAVLMLAGVFAGIFVGCLALAIAEMLNSIPIFARRIGFRHGLGIMILAVALGKIVGSLLYFIKEIYMHGGT